MRKRVVVTGLGGFIGRQCIEPLLARGYELHGLGRATRPIWLSSKAEWHQVDLLDDAAAALLVRSIRPSHFLHLAWYTAHGSYWRSPENATWVRVGIALMEAFAAAGGKRFVGAGSCAEYDWDYGFLSERISPTRPRTPFGRFKLALGEALHALADVNKLSFAWGRVFFVYGPHEQPGRLTASVIESLLQGRSIRATHGRQIRDFSHAADVGGAFVALLDSNVTGVVNVGSGRPTSVRELIERLVTLVGTEAIIDWGAVPLSADEPPLLVADVRRLCDEVGYSPQFGLNEGLLATLNDFRNAVQISALKK